jgi:hypothetical protein
MMTSVKPFVKLDLPLFVASTMIGVLVFLEPSIEASPNGALKTQANQADKTDLIRFKELASGRARWPGAVTASFTNYESADGVRVRRIIASYGTMAAALGAREKILAGGSPAENAAEFDRELKNSRRHTLVHYRSPRNGMQWAVVWTEGPTLFLLESTSVRHLRSIEMQVYP